MKLRDGETIGEIRQGDGAQSRWTVVSLVQETRYRRTYLARSVAEDLQGYDVLLKVCRYDERLLGNRTYVDNVRRRLKHEARMLATPLNVLPQPIDFFITKNVRDRFRFDDAEAYAASEPVLVTERFCGTPLDVLVKKRGALPEGRSLDIALRVCDLLDELHALEMLAFELRPEDLAVDESDHDSLWVLGCANYQKLGWRGSVATKKLVVPLTDFGFTAPEIEAGGGTLDRRTDLYSVGALLYYLLTGKRARDVLSEDGGSLEAGYGRAKVSETVRQLVDQCLSEGPSKRPATVGDVRATVGSLLGGDGARAAPNLDRPSVSGGGTDGDELPQKLSRVVRGTAATVGRWGRAFLTAAKDAFGDTGDA